MIGRWSGFSGYRRVVATRVLHTYLSQPCREFRPPYHLHFKNNNRLIYSPNALFERPGLNRWPFVVIFLALSLLGTALLALLFHCLLISVTLFALLAAFVLRICTRDGVGVVLLVMGRGVGRWD